VQINEDEEEHPPENTSITALNPAVPLTCTPRLVWVATKEYHTSSSAVPVHPGKDCVAFATVPVTGTQLRPGTNGIAPKQLSFAGCANTKSAVKKVNRVTTKVVAKNLKF
jgi:hypothetical protein